MRHHKLVFEDEFVLLVSDVGSFKPVSKRGWYLDRIDQRALPLDQKYIVSQYAGKSADVYVLDIVIQYTVDRQIFNSNKFSRLATSTKI